MNPLEDRSCLPGMGHFDRHDDVRSSFGSANLAEGQIPSTRRDHLGCGKARSSCIRYLTGVSIRVEQLLGLFN